MTSSVSAHFTAIAGLAWDVLLILIDILEISRIHSLPQVWTSAFVTNIKISKHLRLRKTNAPDVAYSGSRRQRSSCPNPCSAETTIGNTTFCRGLGPIWNTVSFRNIFNDPTGEKNQNLYSMNSMRTSAIFRTFWRFAFLAQSSPRKPCVHRHDFPYYTVCFYTAKQGRVRCRLRPAAASLLVFRSWEKKAEMHSSSLSGLKKLELSFWFYDSTYDWLPLSLLKDYYKFIHMMIMEFIDNYNNFIHMTIQWLPLSILPVSLYHGWWMFWVPIFFLSWFVSHSDCAQHLVAQCIQALELHTTLAGTQNVSWVNMETQMETQNIPAAIGDLMNLYESQESQTKNVDFENSNVNHAHVRVFRIPDFQNGTVVVISGSLKGFKSKHKVFEADICSRAANRLSWLKRPPWLLRTSQKKLGFL